MSMEVRESKETMGKPKQAVIRLTQEGHTTNIPPKGQAEHDSKAATWWLR